MTTSQEFDLPDNFEELLEDYDINTSASNVDQDGFLSSFDINKHELFPLSFEENPLAHICDPFDMDLYMPSPNCDECFKIQRPALFRILSLGTNLRDIVFPPDDKFSIVYPNNMLITAIHPEWHRDSFFNVIDSSIFEYVHNLVARTNDTYFTVQLKLKMHLEEVLRTMHDIFFPLIYNDLLHAPFNQDLQRIAHHTAMTRIIGLRIAIKRIMVIVKHYKEVYTMHNRAVNLSAHEALIMTQLEAKEFVFIPLSINYANASVQFKKNSFFALMHAF